MNQPVQEHLKTGSHPVLAFDGPLVIVGGGAVDFELLRQLHASGAHLVGADGGGDAIAAAGLMPDAIIGDLDSLIDPEAWAGKTHLVRIEEQITTDFEKALYSTVAPVTVGVGMTGKRLDHTLAALSAVTQYAASRWIILVDETDLALGVSGDFKFKVEAGERVSIHPLLPIDFAHSDGLLYPMDKLRLKPGGLIGTSNAALTGPFLIQPRPNQPPWLLILDRQHLPALIKKLRR